MNHAFHPEAEAELNQAIDHYEEIEPGLGYDFVLEIYSTIQRSVIFPKAWPVVEGEIRRSLTRRFPYGILYTEEQASIYIVAVMNLHRHPDYWKHRK